MNILHIGKYFPPFHGGLENYMRDLMVALGRRGITCAALVHQHTRSLKSLDETIKLDGQHFRVVRSGTWAKLFFAPISPAFPWQLRQLIAGFKPDILHLHMPNPSAFWCLSLPSARRIPWVVQWQADVITSSQGWLMKLIYHLYRPFESAVLRRASAIVAATPPYRDSSQPLQPYLAKCRVVPLGMDAHRLALEKTELQPARDHFQGLSVLAIGRLTYYKGIRYLVEATAMVENMRLDIVGDGDESRDLRALAASLNLEARVTFHGITGDRELAKLLAGCHCVCLPSVERTEAFGMVLLEAMCFGKATVVADVPGSGMGWIVDHGVTGLKVRPADAATLADAFRQLGSDRDKLGEMGQAGRRKFERLFEINQTAEGIVDVYRAVLANQGVIQGFGSDRSS